MWAAFIEWQQSQSYYIANGHFGGVKNKYIYCWYIFVF